MAAPFDRIEEEADDDIAGDLCEDPPPRASAPPLSEGVRHAEPMPIAAAAEVPSERFLGERRREQLKRKAATLFFAPFARRFRASHPRQCLSKIPGMLFRHLAM